MNCEEKISKCEEIKSDPYIIINDSSGGKSEFRLENSKRIKVRIIRVDNCVIKDDTTRCDYVIEIPIIKVVLFVELKGNKVEYGIKQLENTINHICFKNRYGSDLRKIAYLVATKVKIPASKRDNYKQKFRKEYNCLLIIGEHVKEDIEKILEQRLKSKRS